MSIRLLALDYILPDHENKCPACRAVLNKVDVQLQIVKGEHVEYTPCNALNCEFCRKWMLRKHHYVVLQSNLQPYLIQLASTARPPSTKKRTSGKPRHSTKSQPAPNRRKIPPDLGIPPAKRQDPGNRLFNQYGVFLPSPTGRRGDFNE